METETSNPSAIILKALHEVQEKVGYVKKSETNEYHKYNYASEASLLRVLRPAMVEAGLVLIQSGESVSEIDQYGNIYVTVDYTLAHSSGAVWPEKIRAFGCGNDRNSKGVGDKGLYKALTGANKYFLFKLFQIETGDDPEKDNGGETTDNGHKETEKETGGTKTPTITEPQQKMLFAVATDAGWSTSEMKFFFKQYYGVEHTKDILRVDMQAILKHIENGTTPDKGTSVEA